jgi:hypothetical protein
MAIPPAIIAGEESPSAARHQLGGHVRAATEEGDIAEGGISCVATNQVPPRGEDGEDEELREQIHPVAGGVERHKHHDWQRDERADEQHAINQRGGRERLLRTEPGGPLLRIRSLDERFGGLCHQR